MKKIFSILLSLAPVVSLGVLAAVPVSAAAPTPASISPTSANYNLDYPTQISVSITWNDAAEGVLTIEDDDETLDDEEEYVLFEDLVVIETDYLDDELVCIGDSLVLEFTFDLGVSFITITAVGTRPVISPTSADWDFYDMGDVETTITWGCAGDIDRIEEIEDEEVVDTLHEGEWNDWFLTVVDDNTSSLNITESYLDGRLEEIGDEVVLTITFDSCDYGLTTPEEHTATLTIKAVGATEPSISPTSATYDPCDPADVEFTIDWDGASTIDEIWNVTNRAAPVKLVGTYLVDDDTLYIFAAYLDYSFVTLGFPVTTLEVTFDDGTEVILTINGGWDYPSLSPTALTWDLDTMDDTDYAQSVITWGCAADISSVVDDEMYTLDGVLKSGKCTSDYDYTIVYMEAYGWMLTIWGCYATPTLTSLGDEVTLNVTFDMDVGDPYFIPVTLTATGIQPSISPTSDEFNLDDPGNVTAEIEWGPHATEVKGIAGLVEGIDYTVDPAVGNETTPSTLNIADDYLSEELENVGDQIVLDIEFDKGEDAKFTITAVGTPYCFIATAAYGTAAAEEIDIIREFRDVVLRPNRLGAKLVSVYYKASPRMADFISQNEALRTVVRVGFIDPIVAILNWSHGLWS